MSTMELIKSVAIFLIVRVFPSSLCSLFCDEDYDDYHLYDILIINVDGFVC